MGNKGKNLIVQNTAVLFAGQLATWAFTTIYTVFVPRRVGPFGWGELTIAGAITTIGVMVVSLGTGTLMVRDIARDHAKSSDMIGTAVIARLALGVPFLAFSVLASLLGHYPMHTQIVIYILSLGMLFQLLTGPYQAGFMAIERMKYNSLSDVISKMVVALLSIGIVLVSREVIWISIVSAVASALVFVLNILWWRPQGRVSFRINWPLLRYLVIGGLPFWATGILLTIYLYIDSLMLSFLTNEKVVGFYGVPTKLFGTLLFLPNILATAMFPALSRAYASAPQDLVKMARRSFNLLLCLSLPIGIGGMLLSKQIIVLFYGRQFLPSVPIMVVLSAMVVPTYLNILVNQFLVATNRQVVWTKVMAAACVVNPLLNLWLINSYQHATGNGAFGASLALLVTEVLMAIAGIWLLPRGVLGMSNVVTCVKSSLAAGVMALVVYRTQNEFLLVPIALGAVVYCIVALALRTLPAEDIAILTVVVTRFWEKLPRSVRTRVSLAAAQSWPALFAEDMRHWQRIVRLTPRRFMPDSPVVSALRLCWRYRGARATLLYRLSHAAYRWHLPALPALLQRYNLKHYALDIKCSVPVGRGLYLPNPEGVHISAQALGSNVCLLGRNLVGIGEPTAAPRLGDGVLVGFGACLLGDITIEDGVQIADYSVVTTSMARNVIAGGNPAHVLVGWSGEGAPARSSHAYDEMVGARPERRQAHETEPAVAPRDGATLGAQAPVALAQHPKLVGQKGAPSE